MSINSSYEQALAALTEIARDYEELLRLSYEKRDAIIQNDGESLRAVTQRESVLAARAAALDKNRELAFDRLGLEGLALDAAIERISQNADGETARAFSRTRDIVVRAVSALKKENERNRELLNAAIEYIDFMFNVIHGTRAPEPLHASRSFERASERNGAVFFDCTQ
ncbi:MAG: flagellar protein FlgN [Clostridiales bacterium]|jgi:hypothetical protein|nr:flagellar protein FlgN [Clostridiales bacterium]